MKSKPLGYLSKKSLLLIFGLSIFSFSYLFSSSPRRDGMFYFLDTIPKKQDKKRPKIIIKDKTLSEFSKPLVHSPLTNGKRAKEEANVQLQENDIYIRQKSEDLPGLRLRPYELLRYDNYNKIQNRRINRDLWRESAAENDGRGDLNEKGLIPRFNLPPILERLLGGGGLTINPNLTALVEVGYRSQFIDNPAIPINQRDIGSLFFNQQFQVSLDGKLGNNFSTSVQYDTKAAFNLQNQFKFKFEFPKENILSALDVGNINLESTVKSLVGGGEKPTGVSDVGNSNSLILVPSLQRMWGLKTGFQLGHLNTNVFFAQQQSKIETLTLKGGGALKPFEIRLDNYDENRHFFLSQYFRDNYEKALRTLPLIASNILITRVEVFVTNRTNSPENLRNIASFTDFGEAKPYNTTNPNVLPIIANSPVNNAANGLYKVVTTNNNLRKIDQTTTEAEQNLKLVRGVDYDILRGAKKLTDREFTFSPELGYISLLTPLRNDEILAVSYEYTLRGQKYKVGELVEDYQNRKDDEVLMLKMLKSSTLRNNVQLPMWDLMMKNIYNLNGFQITKQGFQLRVIYKDDQTGIDNPTLLEGRRTKDIPIVQVLGSDKLNYNGDLQQDALFDFVENITIDTKNGRIIFPVLEPFGSHLAKQFDADESALADKYVHNDLYRKTLVEAQLVTAKNKFFLKGLYQSGISGGDIQLPFGVDARSVVITMGGTPLVNGVDYQIDPQSGRLRIINPAVSNSGRDIKVDYEKPDLFQNQTRTIVGLRLNYDISRDFRIGSSITYYNESPVAFLSRVGLGNEPLSNTLVGFNTYFKQNSEALTRFLDALPLISTKTISSIEFMGEYARLFGGVNSSVNNRVMVDDFEGARTVYDMMRQPTLWKIGSTPESFNGGITGGIESNFRRAKLIPYNVDLAFYGKTDFSVGQKPDNLESEITNFYERDYQPQDIFPNRSVELFNLPLGLLDVAYYPSERGIYNFNPDLSEFGLLKSPKQNFGAITRAIASDIDFDNANVEVVEFWALDPFLKGTNGIVRDGYFNANNTTGGKLLLQLGDISEDVIPDKRFNFENGLPIDGNSSNVVETIWGKAPKQQFLTNAFDNQPGSRAKQDVGLDGLTNEEERAKYATFLDNLPLSLSPEIREAIRKDPANDDYQFFLSDEFNQEKDPNRRIAWRYKKANGIENNSPETTSALSQTNSYQPDIEDLNRDNTINDIEAYYQYELDLKPSTLEVGKNFIVDKVERKGATWYLFRIPIRNYTTKVGTINGFKSIRFLRMVFTEFEQPLIMRFAQFQFSSFTYRKYAGDLNNTGVGEVPEPYDAQFKVGSVSIEENGSGSNESIPYRVPPGFVRDRNYQSLNNLELNEQALAMSVTNLRDGDSRAVFKNVNYDILNHERLNLFIHMHNDRDESDKVGAFIRLGTDNIENFYEIEKTTLKATPRAISNPTPEAVWPVENQIDISLDEIRQAKLERNRNSIPLNVLYSYRTADGKYKISVKGNPDLSSVQTMMIGMRNPKSEDGQPKAFTLWVNEFTAQGFTQKSGDAAIGRLRMNLADLGTVEANANIRTAGFGGVHQKNAERSRETAIEWGIAATLKLDKLLPHQWNMQIPVSVSYNERTAKPQFNPLDPDILYDKSIESYSDSEKRKNVQNFSEDQLVQKSIVLNDVRKLPTEGSKRKLYSIENFSFSYAFSSVERRNITIAEYSLKRYQGGLTYNFSGTPKTISPFKKLRAFEKDSWELIRDFNFNIVPSVVMFRAGMDRSFIKNQLRGVNLENIAATYEKYWYFNRDFQLTIPLAQSLQFNYSSQNNSVIDEPFGAIDTEAKKDSVMRSLRQGGRPKVFEQKLGLQYKLPLEKTRLTDWISADYSFNVAYNYRAGAFNLRDENNLLLGNVAQNNRTQEIRGQVDFVKLYNKVKSLQLANERTPERTEFSRLPGDFDELDILKKTTFKAIKRAAMLLRGINFSYSLQESTILPGFLEQPRLLGLGLSQAGAPGLPFILGSQDPEIRFTASRNGWLTNSATQPLPFMQSVARNFELNVAIEPINDFKINVFARWNASNNYQEFYRPAQVGGAFESITPIRNGSYSMSFLSFLTAFDGSTANHSSSTFERFQEYRTTILNRLNNEKTASGQYNLNSQDVLIPAFFSAYSGLSPEKIQYSPFYDFPLPNWRAEYTGLTKLPLIKDIFESFNVRHSYASTYSVGNFTSSIEYNAAYIALNGLNYQLSKISNEQNQLIPIYVMSVVSFTEKFSPLLGVDFKLKNNFSGGVEYNQDRNIALSFSNAQVGEITNKDLTFRLGFVGKNIRLPMKIGGEPLVLTNDLKFDLSVTLRDTRTIQRRIDAESIITAGNVNFQIRPSITYEVSKRLMMQLYYDRLFNDPLVTNSFRRSNTQVGLQLRLNLQSGE